jgi:phage terminase small subunit
MTRKGEQLTPQQRIFVNNAALTGNKVQAARAAGYKHPEIKAHAVAAKPAVQAEIRRQQLEMLFNEVLPLAVGVHLQLLKDPKTPAGARVQAVKLAYDRTLGLAEGAEHKEPHEMTSDEIAKAIGQLEAVAFARAKPVLELESAQGAQQVRNEDVFS